MIANAWQRLHRFFMNRPLVLISPNGSPRRQLDDASPMVSLRSLCADVGKGHHYHLLVKRIRLRSRVNDPQKV
jgi:hypothetical protein